jgi:2-iminobutanoate/2-iminopropanoate deaminase
VEAIEFIKPDWPWVEKRAYTPVIRAGDYVWLAGVTAIDENGDIVGRGDLMAQTHQIFRSIRELLNLAGCDLTSVIRMTNYFAVPLSQELAERFWEVRKQYFGDHRPASTGVQVAALMTPERLLEVDVVAYSPK